MSFESEHRPISDRVALALAGVTLSLAIAGIAKECSGQTQPDNSPTPRPTHGPIFSPAATLPENQSSSPLETSNTTQTPEINGEETINLGDEVDLSLSNLGLNWTPDGHISYISFSNGQKRFFTTALKSSYIVATSGISLESALEAGTLNNPKNVREVLSQTQNPEYNYSGITSVFQLDNSDENHLTAILHQEQWPSPDDGSGFTASIGAFESFDGGLTWTNGRTIIKGDDIKAPGGENVSGAGQPNAIQIGDYLNIYFIDWSGSQPKLHPDQIYLARVKVANGTIDNNIEYFTENGFSPDVSNMKPVIPVPSDIQDSEYTALPSVSFNNALGKYLMISETNVGFVQSISENGITWSNPVQIMNFPQPQSQRQVNESWNSYPTLLSDNQEPNDHTTDETGNFYFSQGYWISGSHNLVVRPFEIK